MRLYAARYEDASTSLASPALLEFFERPANIGLRCSLPGWLQRGEVTIRARNLSDAQLRYENHLDQRMVVMDSQLNVVASGWVKEIVPDGLEVTYVFAGPWKEHDRAYDTTAYASSTTVSSALSTILDDHVGRISTDRSNITTNSTQVGDWDPNGSGGQLPSDLIGELLEFSDASGNLYDYWLAEQPLQFVTPQLHVPYYQARSNSATVNWTITRRDFAAMGLMLSRHIWDYATDVEVYYGSTPTGTGGTTATETPYGTRERVVAREKFNSTVAPYYEQATVNLFAAATQQQGFVLSAPRIRGAGGAMVPLWDVIRNGPGYVRADLSPELSLYSVSRDAKQTFFISAADYDYRSNTLRLVPELPDSRLDAVLRRATGVADAKGEYIQRGEQMFADARVTPDPGRTRR